jgi:hypothetical protein
LNLRFLQAAWWSFFGYWAVVEVKRISEGRDLDCFMDLGHYRVCDATQMLSIYSSLFLLMTQALVSRMLVPGMSIFVNASVIHFLFIASCDIINCLEGGTNSRAADLKLRFQQRYR